MSGTDLEKRQRWCATARSLLDAKGANAATPTTAKPKLKQLRDLGRPVELADDEWATFDSALSSAEGAMTRGDAKSKPTKPLPMMARGDLEEALKKADAAAKIVEQRQKDFNAAVTPKLLAVLLPATVTKLRSNKTPATVCAEATRLIAEADVTSTQFAAIKDYGDPAAAAAQRVAFDDAIGKLDLILAEDQLGKMKTTLKEAEDEKAEVDKLQLAHASAGNAPTTVKDWRKLADHERRFTAVKAEMPKAISAAEGSSVSSKVQQVTGLKQPVQDAVTNWPGKSIAEKLSTHSATEGSITWLEERLDRLLAPTADPAAVAAAREAREWAAFLQDVDDQWQNFVQHNYAAAFRGPFAPRRLKTDSVKAKSATTNTFNAAGKTFTKASSDTTGVSYHTPLDPPFATNANGQEIRSFIYHI